jgi:hypothetical protein
MKCPSKETVRTLRKQYPTGCTVQLISMDDSQAPPVGTLGKVIAVDDVGTIHVAWQTGSSLGIAFGQDHCRKVD